MYKPGQKILVKNKQSEEWKQRWFVAIHPFNNKIVTSDQTQELASWFLHSVIKSKSNDSQTNQEWSRSEGGIDARYYYVE